MMTIHMGACLGVPARYPMILNGHRSMVLTPRQEALPLYVKTSADYKFIDSAIQLLESNLKAVLRGLERLREFYHLGGQGGNPSGNLPFPNRLSVILYKICEFNV